MKRKAALATIPIRLVGGRIEPTLADLAQESAVFPSFRVRALTQTLHAKQLPPGTGAFRNRLYIVAGYAFALYTDLITSGKATRFSETMLKNRGVSPSDPEFFRNVQALEEFAGLVKRYR